MHRIIPALGLLVLTACATPLEDCRDRATRDLSTIDTLIAETRANIDRGYALRDKGQPGGGIQFCAGNVHNNVGISFCNSPSRAGGKEPVAIDVQAERRKLASLRQERQRLEARTTEDLKACERAHSA